LELEDVFSSRPRLTILKMIYTLGQLNVSDVARRIRTNHAATLEHLQLLEAEGILEERTYGRVRMFRFGDSAKAKAVAGLIEAWATEPLTDKH
jgi:predicted ArsR family transcriptional regulator